MGMLGFLLLAVLPGHAIELMLPTPTAPVVVRVVLQEFGQPAAQRWETFLSRYFDYFDLNADGQLDVQEAERLMSLPVPGRQEAKWSFAKADHDRNQLISKVEMIKHFRQAGFQPTIWRTASPNPTEFQVGQRLSALLDANRDGIIEEREWQAAPRLMARFDLNEDEYLTHAELLDAVDNLPPLRPLILRPSPNELEPRFTVTLSLGNKDQTKPVSRFNLDSSELSIVAQQPEDRSSMIRMSHDFFLTQYEQALNGKPTLPFKEISEDAALSAIARMFEFADRNRDGQLSLDELRQFLELVEEGLTCQSVLEISALGPNLWASLDEDGDGRLSDWELVLASQRKPLKLAALPYHYRLRASRGLSVEQFGPVPVPQIQAKSTKPKSKPIVAPPWFLALDRNQDGYLSRAEFLGSPARFAEMDKNRDGRISPEEAQGR